MSLDFTFYDVVCIRSNALSSTRITSHYRTLWLIEGMYSAHKRNGTIVVLYISMSCSRIFCRMYHSFDPHNVPGFASHLVAYIHTNHITKNLMTYMQPTYLAKRRWQRHKDITPTQNAHGAAIKLAIVHILCLPYGDFCRVYSIQFVSARKRGGQRTEVSTR